MRKEKINGYEVEFFDCIDELPIARFHKYSRYMLVESGIGSDLNAVDSHISRAVAFLKTNDTKNAVQEMLNLRQALFFVNEEQDLAHKAFLCLVKSVNGRDWKDLSDDGIDRLYKMLNGEAEGKMTSLEEGVKKKIDEELNLYFPNMFVSSDTKNMNYLLKRRALLQVDKSCNHKDVGNEIEELTTRLLTFVKPKCFEGKDSAEILFDKEYERLCLQISKETGRDAKSMSVMEYYTALEYLQTMQEEFKKRKTKRKK